MNRTAPEIRGIFRKGHLGNAGSNKFLFDQVGIVEAYHVDPNSDLEAAAIEAGANEVEALTREQNDDIPENAIGGRFLTERSSVQRCAAGEDNLCDSWRLLGMHRAGVFAERVVVPRASLVPLPDDLDPRRAVLAEPLACCVGALAPYDVGPGTFVVVWEPTKFETVREMSRRR